MVLDAEDLQYVTKVLSIDCGQGVSLVDCWNGIVAFDFGDCAPRNLVSGVLFSRDDLQAGALNIPDR